MTVAEVSKLYDRIINQILRLNLKEAFSNLGYLIQLNGFGLAYDELTEMENNYRYMLKYRMEGYPDPQRESVITNLRKNALELTDHSYHLWMIKNSSDYYYDRIRVDRVGELVTHLQLFEELRHFGEKLAMIELVEHAETRSAQLNVLARDREKTASRFFNKIWISSPWKESDRRFMTDVFNNDEIFTDEKALFVSALFLSLQKRMDPHKFLLLMELCLHEQAEISQRSLVVLVLSIFLYDGRMVLYSDLLPKLSAIMEHPRLQESLIRVFFQLVRSKDTENVTKRMQEEILPEMTKFGSTIQDKMRNAESEDPNEEFNPDWKNMMDNTDFSVKMQEFSNMQLEGIDVYMSTFSTQKAYPFFQEMTNWFLPFYPTHSSLSDLFENNPMDGTSILDAVLKSDYLCSSDKYSFCFNVLQIPASYRSSMANQFGADSEAYEEIKKAEMGLNAQFKLEQTSNRYIQDLYRFFNINSKKRDFINVFALPLDFHNTKTLGSYLQSEQALKRIGFLYLKNNNFNQALEIIVLLINIDSLNAELYQKKGFCLQQLGEKTLALEAYLQADLIESGSLWTIKRIAACYRQLKMPNKALEYYHRAELLDPDKMALTMNIGHCLVEEGDYAAALKYYFKAEVLSEESPKTWRPIAWCSFMSIKYDLSGKYYQKLLQANPTLEDYMNAGHLEWCKGSPQKAVECYKKGIRTTHAVLPEFMELFWKDVDELIRHGIDPNDIAPVRDELLYELED